MAASTKEYSDLRKATPLASLQRAYGVFGLVHSADGKISLFRDHFPRHLSSAANIAGKALGGNAPLRITPYPQPGEMDADTLIKAFSECRQLAGHKDLELVSAVQYLVRDLQSDDKASFSTLWQADPHSTTVLLNNLLEDWYFSDQRNDIIAQSLKWQNQAKETQASVCASITNAFAAHGPIFACKVDLLHQDHVPKTKGQAAEQYVQLLQGQVFPHANASQVKTWQSTFHTELLELLSSAQQLRTWVYVASYSRLIGPYTTAILLFDGASAVADEVHHVLQTAWNTTTDGRGYSFPWSPTQCQWAGAIESADDVKFHELLHGLECVALSEMYVRPRCLRNQPTFVVGSTLELNKETENEHV